MAEALYKGLPDKGLRTGVIWGGIIVILAGNMIQVLGTANSILGLDITGIIVGLVGRAVVVYGCYLWTQIKNRHWAFMFWGILAPIGFLGICLLKDKADVVVLDKGVNNG